jgi:hypothetical protein
VAFEPTTPNLGGLRSIDWVNYRIFLDGRYTKEYAKANYNYARKYLTSILTHPRF